MKLFTGVVCLFALCAVTFAQSNVNGQAGANTQQAGVNTQTGVQQPNTGSGLIPGAGVDAQVPGVAGLGVNLGRKRRDADSQGAVVNGQLPGTQVAGSAQQGAVQAPVGSQVGVQTSLGGAGLGVGRKRRQVAGQAGANTRQAGLNSQTGVQQRNTGSGLIPGAGLGAQVPGVAGLGVNLGRKRRDADTQGVAVNGQLPGTQVAGGVQQGAVQAPVGSQAGVQTPVGGVGLGVGRKRRQIDSQVGANTQQAGVNTQTGVQQPNTGSGLIPGAGVDAQVPGVAGLGVNLGRKRRDAEPLGAVVNGQLPGTQVAGSAQQSAVQAPVGSQVGVQTPVGGAGLGVGRKRRQIDSQVGVGAQPVATGSQFGVNSAGSQPVAAGSQFGAQPVGAQPVATGTQVGATPVGTQPVAPNVAPLVTAGDVGGRKRRGVNAQVGVGSQPLPVNAQGQAGVNGANTQTGANVQG